MATKKTPDEVARKYGLKYEPIEVHMLDDKKNLKKRTSDEKGISSEKMFKYNVISISVGLITAIIIVLIIMKIVH